MTIEEIVKRWSQDWELRNNEITGSWKAVKYSRTYKGKVLKEIEIFDKDIDKLMLKFELEKHNTSFSNVYCYKSPKYYSKIDELKGIIAPKILELRRELKRLVKEAQEIKKDTEIKITLCDYSTDEIKQAVATVNGITVEQLESKRNVRPLPDARKMFTKFCLDNTKLSLASVGKCINKKHCGIIAQREEASYLYDNDKEFRTLYDEIEIELTK